MTTTICTAREYFAHYGYINIITMIGEDFELEYIYWPSAVACRKHNNLSGLNYKVNITSLELAAIMKDNNITQSFFDNQRHIIAYFMKYGPISSIEDGIYFWRVHYEYEEDAKRCALNCWDYRRSNNAICVDKSVIDEVLLRLR